jgi:alpha-beta hydrolase superfamily lysophospholipase
LHGYYDHAGVLKHLIHHLVDAGYVVATLDQVGHGLSTGAPAAIGDFDEYIDGLNQWVEFCHKELPGPLHLVGHSMGCAVVLDPLLTGKELPLEKIVLLAPLVKSVGWKTSGWGLKLAGGRLVSVPRTFRKNSSDKEFLAFYQLDPLQARTVPMSWVVAHRKWHDERILKTSKISQRKIRLIQGTKDTTVDWKHNLKFLRKRIPNVEVLMIEGGGHQLMNETLTMRRKVFEMVLKGLNE